MPAEFAPHAGCWMLWPERPDNWRDGAQPAQRAFAEVASAIARFEPVRVGVSAAHYEFARSQLPPAVRVVEISHDDAWMRDVGPTFVVNKKGVKRGVDWRFNAWGGLNGGLYFPWNLDDAGRAEGARDRSLRPLPGARDQRGWRHSRGRAGHGAGHRAMPAEPQSQSRISDAREIEEYLRDYLGVREIIWLGEGVINDETDGHVDNLACFVKPGVIALHWTDDTRDPQYAGVPGRAAAPARGARCARARASR